MLLLRLLLFRLSPLLVLGLCKEAKQKKRVFIGLLVVGMGVFLTAIRNVIYPEVWRSLFYIPVAMFPQCVFYGFAIWLIFRCLWYAWSTRVWKRIFRLSVLVILFGILTEIYINPQILNFFVKKF